MSQKKFDYLTKMDLFIESPSFNNFSTYLYINFIL